MKQSIKASLLSGLVFPGLGQLVLKRYGRGLAFMAVALACTFQIVSTAVEQVMRSLPALESGDITNLPVASGGDAGWAVWLLLFCWIVAVVDAYRTGDGLDRQTVKR